MILVHCPDGFPRDFFFFFMFQDVAGNSLGLLPPSFPAAIVDSGKCHCNNRFSLREFPINTEHAKPVFALESNVSLRHVA